MVEHIVAVAGISNIHGKPLSGFFFFVYHDNPEDPKSKEDYIQSSTSLFRKQHLLQLGEYEYSVVGTSYASRQIPHIDLFKVVLN